MMHEITSLTHAPFDTWIKHPSSGKYPVWSTLISFPLFLHMALNVYIMKIIWREA